MSGGANTQELCRRDAQPVARAVFLDRDGTINEAIVRDGKPFPAADLKELRLAHGAREALERLKAAGFLLIVATNQPDVARGTMDANSVEEIHRFLFANLPLDDIRVCYADADANPLRKPNPGMLFETAEERKIDLTRSFMVGDRWKDVEAGRRAGCRTVFLENRYAERKPDPPADYTAGSLVEAAEWILAHGDQE